MYVSTDSCLWLLQWAAQSRTHFAMWCFATQAPAGQVISLHAHRWCYEIGPFCNCDGKHLGSVRVLLGACIVLHPTTSEQSHGGPTLTLFYLASTTSHVSQSGNSETTYPWSYPGTKNTWHSIERGAGFIKEFEFDFTFLNLLCMKLVPEA